MKVSRIPRTTLSYLVVIVLLITVYVVQETTSPRRNTIPIPEIADEVDRIVMERDPANGEDDNRLEVYRDQEGWRVRRASSERAGDGASDDSGGAPESYRADSAGVDALLQDIAALSAADVISTRGNYEEYGLAGENTRRVRFFVGNTQPLAIEFGGTAAAGDAVYGRINGSREVVLLPRSLASAVTTDPEELRDTAVVRLPEEQVTHVEIRSPDHETLTLSRERPGDSASAAAEEGEPVWRVEPESEDGPIAPGRVRDFFTELNPLRAQQFLSDDPRGEPFAEILVRLNGNRGSQEIRIWPPDEDRRYPVRAASAEQAVLVPEWRARRLLLGLERYFEPFATEADPSEGAGQPATD
ncbi:MAG: DUF4340 domain-containing protein [Alkalispirochaeta sp.]